MADQVLVSQVDNCTPIALGSGAKKNLIAIGASVGLKGVNRPEDVRTIQNALNELRPDQGGPAVKLDVDGLSGPKTQAAIRGFQMKHFGFKGADGRIDPGHQTLAKLNEVRTPAASGGLGLVRSGPERLEFVRTLLPEVQEMIRSAIFHLALALPFIETGQSAGLIAPASIALVNRHFAFDKLPASRRRGAMQRVTAHYQTMLAVFQRPGGLWGPAAFDHDSAARLPPQAKLAQAYTRFGAFFRSGEKDEAGQRIDAIYLLDHFDRMPRKRNVRNLVHELAHFVGPAKESEAIDDLAYGWFDAKIRRHQAPFAMSQLSADQRARNADSYANLAFEAKFREKPPGDDL